jgi:transcriptional regulator with XRE-family HTH domain
MPPRSFPIVPARKFHEVLADLIDASPLTQTEIATRLGYDRPNLITMFKQGSTKVPVNKIGPLARILEVDAVWLLRRALREYSPDLWEALEETLGPRVTANAVEILSALRVATDDTNPRLNGPAAKVKIEELAAVLTT